MFAFALFDHIEKTLLLVVDRFGIKPLYYSIEGQNVFFSSDINAIWKMRSKNDLNIEYFNRNIYLDHFIGFTQETPFKGIDLLSPGSYLIFKDDNVEIKKYYDISNISFGHTLENEENLASLFETSVKNHLISDVAIGCNLSGGFDSSLIAVFASKYNAAIKFLSVNPNVSIEDKHSDLFYSKFLYDFVSSETSSYHNVSFEESWSLSSIDRFVTSLGTPIYDDRVVVWNALYSYAKKSGVKVVLNGQGADELWYGYYPKIWRWFSNLFHEQLDIESVSNYINKQLKSSAIGQSLNCSKKLQTKYNEELYHRIKCSTNELNDHKQLTCFMINSVLPSLLKFEDSISMLNSVEVRVPFLDHKLVEYALSMPSQTHLQCTFQGKDYLKKVFRNHLPIEIIERTKKPLPKGDLNNDTINNLFLTNINELKNSDLIGKLYDRSKLAALLQLRDQNGFYGRPKEAMLQILTTWRFEKLFCG